MSASKKPGQSLIAGLPPEIAKQINLDWRKNEAEYWTKRDSLLTQYSNKWIGFAEGRVMVSGTSPVEVFHTAQASGRHPFVTCVGHENEPNRMRRTPMKRKALKYNYGECEICDTKLVEKRIKQNFWIRGKLVVIDNVPAGVCPRCGAKVVRSQVGKRVAMIVESPKKWSKASVITVPVVELRS